MTTVLIRLLTLRAENVIPEVIWGMVLIYVFLMLVTLTSVWVTCRRAGSRFLWFLAVVFLPFVGIMAHCLHCLTLADLSSLKQFGIFTRKTA